MAQSCGKSWRCGVVQTGWLLCRCHLTYLLRHTSRRQGGAPTARYSQRKSRRGETAFGLHLVQSGLVEAEWGASIGIGLDARLTADYDAETSFTDADARDECDRARGFLKRIGELLLANGFTAEELRIKVSGS